MKKLYLYILSIATTLIIVTSCAEMNPRLAQAAAEAVTAITISDQQVMAMTSQFMQKSDAENSVAPDNDKYAIRLKRVTAPLSKYAGRNLNFKVYKSKEVNAFATADGSIRVYSGLMDVMTDDELLAVLGHEIGHVVNHDVRDAMRNAYISTATRLALGSISSDMERISDSVLGDIGQAFVGSQFSQKQELQADDYAFNFMASNGRDPYAMANALTKIAKIAGGSNSNAIAQLFSTHPDSARRALRMKERADQLKK